MPHRLQVNGIGTHLKVRDIAASRAFYEGVLGFTPVFAYGDQAFLDGIPDGVPTAPERYHGVTYEPMPNCPFEIADGHIAVPDRGVFDTPIASPKVSAMIRVASLVPLFERGVQPRFPIRHYYWGTIEMALRDPDGWVLIFIAPYSEAELEAVGKHSSVEEVTPNG